jgi:hypothetical protein
MADALLLYLCKWIIMKNNGKVETDGEMNDE